MGQVKYLPSVSISTLFHGIGSITQRGVHQSAMAEGTESKNSTMAAESPHSGQGHAVSQKKKERGQAQLQGHVTCVVTQGRRLIGAPPLV